MAEPIVTRMSVMVGATVIIESAGYDGGDACRGILKSIRAGWLIFIQPDKLQLTREGEAHLQREMLADA